MSAEPPLIFLIRQSRKATRPEALMLAWRMLDEARYARRNAANAMRIRASVLAVGEIRRARTLYRFAYDLFRALDEAPGLLTRKSFASLKKAA